MPKRGQLTRARSSKQLLKRLTDSPALPAFVRTLQVPVLKRLIDHVGLHDAGDLIALTTPEQLRGIFEESLWETLVPGQTERLRPEKFLEWLDVMLEVGPVFAAQRLIELGDTFVVVNFAPLITVVDRGVGSEHQEGTCFCVICQMTAADVPFEMIGEHIVTSVHRDEWDAIKTVLVELEGEDGEFLDRVLARCSTAPTMRSFGPDGESLLEDETYEREQRRERGGFMTPPIAAMFLKSAKTASLDALASQTEYDDVSRRYFDQLAAAAGAAEAERERASAAPLEEADDTPPATPAQMRALETALVDAEIVGDRQPLLLQGPKDPRAIENELQVRLDRLQIARPDVFGERLGELVYLANILMAGSWYQGGRFTETEAAQAALACANLGLDHLLDEEADLDAAERAHVVETLLEQPPGIVRLFQLGWNLLQALPHRCAVELLDALRSDHVREQLQRKRWILDEIESAVSDPDLLGLIDRGEFADVGDNLALLSLVLDARACQCLRTLITDFPRYPLQLNLGFRVGSAAATNETRYLTTRAQLEKVDVFLTEIDTLLKI